MAVFQGKKVCLKSVARMIKSGKIKNIAVMTGAGISVSAGIPDFRSPKTGLYSQLEKYDLPTPESIFDINFFKERPEAFCRLAKELFPGNFKPTTTHHFIRLLQDKKLLHRCFTQNIDNLERLAGIRPDLLVEAHGSFAKVRCIDCSGEWSLTKYKEVIEADGIPRCQLQLPILPPTKPPTDKDIEELTASLGQAKLEKKEFEKDFVMSKMVDANLKVRRLEEELENSQSVAKMYPERFAEWEKNPKVRACRGLVKPDIVFFGESLPDRFSKMSDKLEEKADLAIVMGTSLKVMPFAGLIGRVSPLCPRLLINREAVGVFGQHHAVDQAGFRFEQKDLNYRDVFVRADCDDGILELVKLLGWTKELRKLESESATVDALQLLQSQKPEEEKGHS